MNIVLAFWIPPFKGMKKNQDPTIQDEVILAKKERKQKNKKNKERVVCCKKTTRCDQFILKKNKRFEQFCKLFLGKKKTTKVFST